MNGFKELLIRYDTNQSALAKKSGISRMTISNIANRNAGMTLDTAFKIAQALDITLEELYKTIKGL